MCLSLHLSICIESPADDVDIPRGVFMMISNSRKKGEEALICCSKREREARSLLERRLP